MARILNFLKKEMGICDFLEFLELGLCSSTGSTEPSMKQRGDLCHENQKNKEKYSEYSPAWVRWPDSCAVPPVP